MPCPGSRVPDQFLQPGGVPDGVTVTVVVEVRVDVAPRPLPLPDPLGPPREVFVGGLLLRYLVRRSSDGFLLWRALQDAEFYAQVVAAGVLKVEPAPAA